MFLHWVQAKVKSTEVNPFLITHRSEEQCGQHFLFRLLINLEQVFEHIINQSQ